MRRCLSRYLARSHILLKMQNIYVVHDAEYSLCLLGVVAFEASSLSLKSFLNTGGLYS